MENKGSRAFFYLVLDEVEKIKQVAIEFYKNGFKLQSNYSLTYSERFFNQLISNLVQEIDLVTSIIKVNGYQGRIGFEYAKAILLKEYSEMKRIPTLRNYYNISGAINSGKWKNFGVNTWNDLLLIIFGETNKEMNKYKGKQGFERALGELREFFKLHHKLPTSSDFEGISGAIDREEWVEFGILRWNDILEFEFNKVNKRVDGIYKGKKGLDFVINELQEYYRINKKIPTQREFSSINSVIQSGDWKQFGIKSWNDLLRLVFGEINHEVRKYTSKAGLEYAINELKKYFNINQKLPHAYHFEGIIHAIKRGEWIEHGVRYWNDILIKAFGKINRPKNKYIGDQGLKIAKKEIVKYYNIHNVIPSILQFKGINSAVIRGEWSKHNIHLWNDIIFYSLGRTKRKPKNTYLGKIGFLRAINEQLIIYQETGIKPKAYQKRAKVHFNCIKKGNWISLGIKNWTDYSNYFNRLVR